MVSWPVHRRSPCWSVSGTLPADALLDGAEDGTAVPVRVAVVRERPEAVPLPRAVEVAFPRAVEVSIGIPAPLADKVPVAVRLGIPPGWLGRPLGPPLWLRCPRFL